MKPSIAQSCQQVLEEIRLIPRCFENTISYNWFDYIDDISVSVAALFAGISAYSAWKANRAFERQRNCQDFDTVIGDDFIGTLKDVREKFQKVKSSLITQNIDQSRVQGIIAAIRSVNTGNFYTTCTSFDDLKIKNHSVVKLYDEIDEKLSALETYVSTQPLGWHEKSSTCISTIESLFSQIREQYFNARKTFSTE